MKKNVFFVAAIFAALCLNSCDKNDPDNPIAGGSGKILLTTAYPMQQVWMERFICNSLMSLY